MKQTHVDGGDRCLVNHRNAPCCIVCKRCGKYVRPEDMKQRCPPLRPKVTAKEVLAGAYGPRFS